MFPMMLQTQIVVDIASPKCVHNGCKTGAILYDWYQSWVPTVIPWCENVFHTTLSLSQRRCSKTEKASLPLRCSLWTFQRTSARYRYLTPASSLKLASDIHFTRRQSLTVDSLLRPDESVHGFDLPPSFPAMAFPMVFRPGPCANLRMIRIILRTTCR